jgi:hypothetical protein
LRRRQVGFFDEGGDRPGFFGGARRGAGADVAIAGVRPLRPDAENHDATTRRDAHRGADRRREVGAASDRVIGRRDDEDRVDAVLRGARGLEGGELQRRRGVASERLEEHAGRRDADVAELLDDREAMLLVGDDAGRVHVDAGVGDRGGAARRLLEQRLVVCAAADTEREVLLRVERAAERPQAGAAAAGEDHRDDSQGGVGHGGVLP